MFVGFLEVGSSVYVTLRKVDKCCSFVDKLLNCFLLYCKYFAGNIIRITSILRSVIAFLCHGSCRYHYSDNHIQLLCDSVHQILHFHSCYICIYQKPEVSTVCSIDLMVTLMYPDIVLFAVT